MFIAIIKSLRPRQWIKNLIVFAPLVFAGKLFDLTKFSDVAVAFILLSLMSGAVYIMNDIADRKRDVLHPRKRLRPIASGILPVRVAATTAALLLVGVFAAASLFYPRLLPVFGIYFILQPLYSYKLRNIAVVDVMTIASGFVLRIYAGMLAADVPFSAWLIAVIFLLGLFLVFAKRRQEIAVFGSPNLASSSQYRNSLTHYNIPWLDEMMGVSAAAIIVIYIIYTLSSSAVARLGTDMLFYSSIFVIFGIFRYLYHIKGDKLPDNPIDLVFKDPALLADIVLYGAFIFWVLYIN